jgi:hypothetical protein
LSGPSPERTSALTGDLARLTDEQRRLAQIAAALGDPFTLGLLAAVAGIEPKRRGGPSTHWPAPISSGPRARHSSRFGTRS